MSLSNELISQLVKSTKEETKPNNEATVKGTAVNIDGRLWVKLDGSDVLTPVETTSVVKDEERVLVLVKDHTATIIGNTTTPSASSKDVVELNTKIVEFDNVMAHKVTTDELSAINAVLNNLSSKVANFGDVSAVVAKIETLQAKYANLDYISANDLEVLTADIEDLQADFATIRDISAEDLEALNADINQLTAYNADFTYVSAVNLEALKADIEELDAKKLDANEAEIKYANIDFANIDIVAVQKLFTESGIIKDLVVKDGHITGELVGVTIKGDLIEAGTVKADKLVVKGSDGLFYKLNLDAMGATTEQVPTDKLHGSVLVAKSVTADQIHVTDLVAFGATIGGFHIGDHSLYSGVKSSATNTTRGVFLGDEGEFAIGDSGNYLRYYKDSEGKYRLEIKAASIKMGTSSNTVEEEIEDVRKELEEAKDNITCNLRIESSRGTVFKNDSVSTVLSAVIYRGSQRITDMTTLRAAMGSSAYLQWKWQRLDESSFGVISSSDTRLGNNGFTFTLSPEDVDTKVTFLCELIT